MKTAYFGLALVLLASRATAQNVDAERLRQATWMPSVSCMTGVGFEMNGSGFRVSLFNDKVDVKPEIAALRKLLEANPGDPQYLFRLAQLLERNGENEAAKRTYEQAGQIYRRLVQANPADSRLLTSLADCVTDAEERESLLRRAVKAAPGNWDAWTALGDHTRDKFLDTLLGEKEGKQVKFDPHVLHELLARTRPAEDRIKQALKVLDEARTCYEKALATKPPKGEVYSHCGMACGWQEMLRAALRSFLGEQVNPTAGMFAPEFLPWFRRAAELSPEDYRPRGWLIWYELSSFALQRSIHLAPSDRGILDLMPADLRRVIKGDMEKLVRLAKVTDKAAAAGCAELLAMYEMIVTGDAVRAEAWARRAIELNPGRDNSWELLLGILNSRKKDRDVLTVSKENLKRKDTAHAHYLVAKAHEALQQFNEAEAQVREALRQSPDDLEANLGLIALLLKRSARAEVLTEAGKALDRVDGLLKEKEPATYRLEHSVNRGIYLGLTGNRDNACQVLSGVLEKDRNHRVAGRALEAMGEAPTPLPPGPWSVLKGDRP